MLLLSCAINAGSRVAVVHSTKSVANLVGDNEPLVRDLDNNISTRRDLSWVFALELSFEANLAEPGIANGWARVAACQKS